MQLESGSMKVFSSSDIQVGAKDTVLSTADRPVDLELGYQADKLNLTVFNGAVQNGPVIIRGGNEDPNVRRYTANGRSSQQRGNVVANPVFYIYPYFLYGNPDPNAGLALMVVGFALGPHIGSAAKIPLAVYLPDLYPGLASSSAPSILRISVT